MNIFSRLKGKRIGATGADVKEEVKYVDFKAATYWEVSNPRDSTEFFKAINDIIPENSTLYMESGSYSRDVRKFLMEHCCESEYKVEVGKGIQWPRPKCFYLPATSHVFNGLAELSKVNAEPEMCDHIVVFKGQTLYVAWYDWYCDPIWISQNISENKIKNFCNKLKCKYTFASQ